MLNRTSLYILCEKIKLLSEVNLWLNSFDEKTNQQIIDWIKFDQLRNQGIDAKGNILGTYSIATEKINPLKVAGTPYTLEDSGEFFQSITIQIFRDYFLINGDGDKDNVNLFDKFGDDILGLTPENLDKLKILLTENAVNYARKILFND